MRTITEYQCEICNQKYNEKKNAIECESKGVVNLNDFKIGTMYSYEHSGYVGIFAIAEVRESNNKHYASISNWACRSPKYIGDSLDEQRCGGGNDSYITKENWIKYHKLKSEYVDNTEFKRMVGYLQAKGITPQYYNEKGELIIINLK